jgi:hypothetical protein
MILFLLNCFGKSLLRIILTNYFCRCNPYRLMSRLKALPACVQWNGGVKPGKKEETVNSEQWPMVN